MSVILYDIVIPSWNCSKYAVNCLLSIQAHSSHYRVIFVDNGSDRREFDNVWAVLKNMPHFLIKNKNNEGFIKATNAGIKKSTAPYIVLMNNDTEAVAGWLHKLVKPLKFHADVGLTGPLTTTRESWQGKWPKGRRSYIIRKKGMLAFFCTMFKREVFDRVGLLDENFGIGFGDDDDFCRRTLNAGYSMALVQDLVIPHHHRTTFKTKYSVKTIKEMQRKALDHYFEKHHLKKYKK